MAKWASYYHFSDLARKQSPNANLRCPEKFGDDPADLVPGRTPPSLSPNLLVEMHVPWVYIMLRPPKFVSKPTPALNSILPFLKKYYLFIMGLWGPPWKPETVKNST